MTYEPPPIRIFIAPTVMVTIIMTVIGLLIGVARNPADKYEIFYFMAGGMAGGLILGLVVSWKLLPHVLPEPFRTYANDTASLPPKRADSDEPPVILLEDKILGITYRLSRLGTPLNDWIRLAQEFVNADCAYNQVLFENVFGREGEIGRSKYYLFSAQFEACKMLEPYGKGKRFTDFGKEKIRQLAKGDWRVLEIVPEEAVAI